MPNVDPLISLAPFDPLPSSLFRLASSLSKLLRRGLRPKHRRNAASLGAAATQWISARSREVAYDQIAEASPDKLAQAVVFWLMRQWV